MISLLTLGWLLGRHPSSASDTSRPSGKPARERRWFVWGAAVLLATSGVVTAQTVTQVPPANSVDVTQCRPETRTFRVCIPGAPPKVDVYILADTTGSMGGALSSVQTAAASIASSLLAYSTDLFVGCGNYKDFPDDTYCFQHNLSPTNNLAAITAALAWSAGGGADYPEGQMFALHEVATSAAIGWRPGAKRVIVWFGDAPGHDPVCTAISGISTVVTEALVTSELQATGTVVFPINLGPAGFGLDDDPVASSSSYGLCGLPGGTPGQGTRIATATGGVMTNLAGIATLPATIIANVGSVVQLADVALQPSGAIVPFVVSIQPAVYHDVVIPTDPSAEICVDFQVVFWPVGGGTFPGSWNAKVNGALAGTPLPYDVISYQCLALSQSAPSPFLGGINLASNAALYVDLHVVNPAGVTLTWLDVNTGLSPIGTEGNVEIYTTTGSYLGQQQSPGAWTLAATGAVTAAGSDVPSHACLDAGVYLAPGVHGIAIRHVGLNVRCSPAGPSNQIVATPDLTVTMGHSQNQLFVNSSIAGRVFNGNLGYEVGHVTALPCASAASIGTGCYAGTTSFYENFASLQACDLGGAAGAERVIAAIAAGPAGFVVTPGASDWYVPTGSQLMRNGSTVLMADDSMSQPLSLPFAFPFPGAGTPVVHASANGFVLLSGTTATTSDWSPTIGEMLSQPARLLPLWCDLDPAINQATNPGSGVYFDIDPSGQAVYITWLDCADRRAGVPVAGTTSVSVQCVLRATGDFEYRYRGIVPSGNAGVVLCGWSKGNSDGRTALDPGAVDLTAAMPFTTSGPDSLPLQLTSNAPTLGGTFALTTTNVPSISPFGFVMFSDTAINPGIDLGFLGAPGCSAYIANLNLGVLTFAVAQPAGSGTVTTSIPYAPSLVGVTIVSQSLALTWANAAGLATSNGVVWTVGN